MEAVSKNFESG